MAMMRPYRPPKHRVAERKEAKDVIGECADCPNKQHLKKDGNYARLCKACLKKDAARAKSKRKGIMKNPIEQFTEVAPSIDSVRDEAAKCALETARYERGERGPLRLDPNPNALLTNEFSDAAAGTAAEVAMVVSEALKKEGILFNAAFCWDTAGKLLRNGWQRGHRLVGHVIGKDAPQ